MLRAAVVVAMLTLACAPANPAAPSETPAEVVEVVDPPADDGEGLDLIGEPFETQVVLREATNLRDTPDGTDRVFVQWGTFAPVRTLRRHGEHIQVKMLVGPLGRLELNVWVDEDRLMPVIEREWSVSYSDGSALTVRAGTPVELEGARVVGLMLERGVLKIEIPESAIARTFESQEWPGLVEQGTLPERAAPELDGQPFPVDLLDRITHGVITNPAKHPPPKWPTPRILVYGIWDADRALGVELAGPSIRVRARVPGRVKVEPRPEGERWYPVGLFDEAPRRDVVGFGEDRYEAPTGTAVRWPGGGVAGTVRWNVEFRAPGRLVEQLRCFPSQADLVTEVCFENDDLRWVPAEPPGRGSGGGYG